MDKAGLSGVMLEYTLLSLDGRRTNVLPAAGRSTDGLVDGLASGDDDDDGSWLSVG